ncbi:hypothetical protein I4U23_023029 [Adineta vaga]|nr:hypothetical protein I4U23_023029 [Adineta vaga]
MTSIDFPYGNFDEKSNDKQVELFCLIWLDSNPNADETLNAEQKLRSIINSVKKFQDVKQCQKYIEECSHKDRLILIVSGQLGRELVPPIHLLRQVTSVYVYCYDTKRNKAWSSAFPKVKAVLNDLDELISRIGEDHDIQKKVDEPLPIHIFTAGAGAGQSTMGVNGQFVFSQVLIDCLLRLKSNETDQTELIDCCQTEYKGNKMELENLREFQTKYTSGQVLSWYTKETFFYKTLNAALRKQNIHMIFLFRKFISDIHQELKKYQSEKILTVYRGQMMTKEELKIVNYGKAVSFLNFTRSSDSLERVLFEIKADPKMVTSKPFADISKHSDYHGEAEVLFMIGSIFRLESIERNDIHIWVIKMSLSSDEEHGLKQVLAYMKGQIESGETNLRTLGKVLWKMGKFDLAEKYFVRLLKERDSTDPLNSILYEELGELAALRGDYDQSIQWHQKFLRLKNSKETDEKNTMNETMNTTTSTSSTTTSVKSENPADGESATTTLGGIDTEQFKEWLKAYIKQKAIAVAEQQNSIMRRHPKSVENFCYILEKQCSTSDDEQQTLRGIINLGFTFDDVNSEECIKFFRVIQNERIILILSKTSMDRIAKQIRNETFLSAIYVIDSSKENSFDSKLYRGTFSNISRLCRQLETDLPLLTYELTSVCSIPADYAKMSTLNYVLTLKDILIETDAKRNLKKEMIEFCREKYEGNVVQLKYISEFERNYQSDNAIQWYLRHETFLYKMLTRALRIFDADILYKLRYFIQHLHRHLESSTETNALRVYRTIRIRKGLMEKMKNYQNGLFSFNEFLFVDKTQPKTEPSPVNLDSKLVHFRIDLAANTPRHVISTKPNEILLTFGMVFHLETIEAINEETYSVKLTTSDKIHKAGQQISKDLREAVRGPFPLVRIAKLMWQRDLYDDMEYFASLLINDRQTIEDESANMSLGGLLHALGGHCYETKQYDKGLVHFQNALKVYLRVLPADDIKLTPSYNNIGSIYHKQELNEKALEYHQKAYDIQKNSTHPDLESVSAYAGNIASVLGKLGKYKEAVKYSEMNLKIQQKLHPNKETGDMAAKYYNLAGMQYRAQLFTEALENYKKCLEIELKCHSAENPTVAVTYHSIGTALDKLGRFQEAKEAVEKAIERLLRTKKEDDKDIQSHRAYIKQLEQKLWMKNLLAST